MEDEVRAFDGPVFVLADNLTGAIRSASDPATLTTKRLQQSIDRSPEAAS